MQVKIIYFVLDMRTPCGYSIDMFYTLRFESRYGLWELKVNNSRMRFYRTRDEAMKLVARYRRAINAEETHQIGLLNNTMPAFMGKLYAALTEDK